MDNTGDSGDLDTEKIQRAMLQYRNTPDRNTKLSPAMCIFGRPIRDFIPIPSGKYKPHETWRATAITREEALRNRHMRCAENLTEHTKRLPQLTVGEHVRLQNQVGPYPKKWDKTGVVIEVRQYDQYVVRVDGSRRVTLRNRKFLREYIPVIASRAKLTLDGDIGLPRSMPSSPEESNGPTGTPTPTLTFEPPSANSPVHTPLPITRISTPKPINSELIQTRVPLHDTPRPLTNQDTRRQLTYDTPTQVTTGNMSPAESRQIPETDAASSPRRSTRQRHAPTWQKDYDMGSLIALP